MWSKIAGLVLRNRVVFLIIVGIITAFMAFQGKNVKLDYEYPSLLPPTDSAYIDLENFRAKFGKGANIMVLGCQDDNFFQKEKFNGWKAMADSLRKIEGVQNVLSVSDLANLAKDKPNKKFVLDPIFPNQLNSQSELDSVKKNLDNLPFYKDLVYFDSTKVYVMAITFNYETINSQKREGVIKEVELAAGKWSSDHSVKMYFSGLPYTRTKIAEMIKSELNLFVFFAMGITALILFVFFRSFKVVFFSMLVVGTSAAWAMGTIYLMGFKMTILTGMIPPLLIVIGIPNCVFLLNKFHSEYRKHGNKIKALHRVISKVGNATFLTNLTTAAGFATFIVTGNSLLVEFGLVASLNILGIFILSITLIPVFFSFLTPPKEKHTKHLDYKLVEKVVGAFVSVTQNKRNVIYITTILLVGIAGYGVSLIRAESYIIDDIPKDNKIYVDLQFFEKNIGGVMPVEISIESSKPKGILKLKTLKKIEKLQKKLESYDVLSKPASIIDAVKFSKQAFYNGNLDFYKLPNSQEKNFILAYAANSKGNSNAAKSFADSTFQTARITLRVQDIGNKKMEELHTEILADMREIFPADKYKIAVTGASMLYAKGTSYLVSNLFTSLILAVLLISIFMATMFSSFKMIIISLLPNILPLLFTAALMGYFGVRIKPSTVLVFSIAFGISVDNAIHFLTKYRQELIANNWEIKQSVINALKETGVSIVYTATILFFGFGVFAVSDFGGTVALGLLVSVTLLFAMLSNLVLLPSLLLTLEKRITTKAFKDSLVE